MTHSYSASSEKNGCFPIYLLRKHHLRVNTQYSCGKLLVLYILFIFWMSTFYLLFNINVSGGLRSLKYL